MYVVAVPMFQAHQSGTAHTMVMQRGFEARTHIELINDLDLVDFERGVKMAGSRSYVLKGDGMRLHQALLRYAFDFMTQENGFKPMSVPVVVRETRREEGGSE